MADATLRITADTSQADRALGKVTAALGALVSFAAVKGLVGITARFQDLETTLGSVFGTAKKGSQAFKAIQQLSTKTQFGIEDLSNTFIKLSAAGIQPTEKLLKTFTDTAAITTDQVGTLSAMTDLFARNVSGGMNLEDLQRLGDRGVPVFDILSEKLKIASGDVSEFGKSAEGSRKIVEALAEGINERFGGATENRLGNLSTLMSNFDIAVKNAAGDLGTKLTPAIASIITAVTNLITNNSHLIDSIGNGLDSALQGVQYLFKLAADNLNILAAGAITATAVLGARGLANAISMATRAMKLLTLAMARNPFGLIAVAVATLISYLAMENGLGRSLAQIKAVVDLVGNAFSRLGNYLNTKFAIMIDWIKTKFYSFIDSMISAYNWIADLIPGMDAITGKAEDMGTAVAGLAQDGLAYAAGKANELQTALANAVPAEFANEISNAYNAAINAGNAFDAQQKMHDRLMAGRRGQPSAELVIPEIQSSSKTALVAAAPTVKEIDKIREAGKKVVESLRTITEATDEEYLTRLDSLTQYHLQAGLNNQDYLASVKRLEDEYLASKTQAQMQQYDLELSLEADKYKKLAYMRAADLKAQGMSGEKALELAKLQINNRKRYEEEGAGFVLDVMTENMAAIGQQNKAAFKAYQAFAIAKATMDTFTSAQAAFASMAAIPIIGVPLGIAAAAGAIAIGMARVSAIRNQQYSGRALGGPVMAGQSYIVGENGPEMFTPATSGGVTRNNDLQPATTNINFYIQANDTRGFDQLLSERKPMIVNMIKSAQNDRGNRSNV